MPVSSVEQPASQISPIIQSQINSAVWNACDSFRGVINADTYKNFIMTMLSPRYLSDRYKSEQQLADLQQEKKALMQVLLTDKKRVLVDGEVA